MFNSSLQGGPLRKLNLHRSAVGDASLAAVQALPITSLGLSNTFYSLKDSSLLALRGMAHLTELDLSGSGNAISETGLQVGLFYWFGISPAFSKGLGKDLCFRFMDS